MNTVIRSCALSIGWLAALVHAADFSSAGYARGAAEYLRLPLHAATASLGGAVTAWRHELAGAQYNPAIIEEVQALLITGSTSFWEDGRSLFGGQMALALGDYLIGEVLFIHTAVDAIELRNEFGTLLGYFGNTENAMSIAVAGRTVANIAWGVRGRYLHQKLWNQFARGMGFDAGVTWQPYQQLTLGASALNLASRLFWSTDHVDRILPQLRLGANATFFRERLTLGLDLDKTLYQPFEFAFAAQYLFMDIVSLRAAMNSSINTRPPSLRYPDISLGAGMRHGILGFDYAITIPLEKTGVVHRISLVFDLQTPIL